MIYVTSDLHGYPLDKLKDFLAKVGFGRDDELYILGDVIDRGPDGVRILQWIMAQPNVKLLLGNHESMMLACETALFDFESENVSVPLGTRAEKLGLWLSNSGEVTFQALLAVRSREVEAILRFLHRVTGIIRTRPKTAIFKSFRRFTLERRQPSCGLNPKNPIKISRFRVEDFLQ